VALPEDREPKTQEKRSDEKAASGHEQGNEPSCVSGRMSDGIKEGTYSVLGIDWRGWSDWSGVNVQMCLDDMLQECLFLRVREGIASHR